MRGIEVDKCGATYELASGEIAGPCHFPKDHGGDSCEGYCLGSIARWSRGVSSEYEQWCKSKTNKAAMRMIDAATEGDMKSRGQPDALLRKTITANDVSVAKTERGE